MADDFSFEVTSEISKESESPLRITRKNYGLTATDLATQYWCEVKTEFLLSDRIHVETDSMRRGTARHELLEDEDHESVQIFAPDKKCEFALKLFNSIVLLEQLLRIGKCREVWVGAMHESRVLLRGIIDELRIEKDDKGNSWLTISDTKTRSMKKKPHSFQTQQSFIQLEVYRFVLEKLREEGLNESLSLFVLWSQNFGKEISSELPREWPYTHLGGTLVEALMQFSIHFQKLPPIRTLEVSYEHEGEIFATECDSWDREFGRRCLEDLLRWWLTPRESSPAQEAWMCRFCDFIGECDQTLLGPVERADAIVNMREKRSEWELEQRENEKKKETRQRRLARVSKMKKQLETIRENALRGDLEAAQDLPFLEDHARSQEIQVPENENDEKFNYVNESGTESDLRSGSSGEGFSFKWTQREDQSSFLLPSQDIKIEQETKEKEETRGRWVKIAVPHENSTLYNRDMIEKLRRDAVERSKAEQIVLLKEEEDLKFLEASGALTQDDIEQQASYVSQYAAPLHSQWDTEPTSQEVALQREEQELTKQIDELAKQLDSVKKRQATLKAARELPS